MSATNARDPEMAEVEREQRTALRWLSIAILALVGITMVILTVMYDRPDAAAADAQSKAAELVAALEDQGLQSLDEETVARVYGTTGGRACTMTDTEQLDLAVLNAQKTGEVNQRPGQVDPRFADYQRAMIETYCPSRLEAFDEFVDGLRLRELREAP